MSMTLYQIDQAILDVLDAVDPETGEFTGDLDQLENLQMEREKKLENIGLYIKNLRAEADAIKAEIDNLNKRRESSSKRADSLARYLSMVLAGSPFKTPRVAVSWRKSKAVELDGGFIEWAQVNRDDLLNYGKPAPNKTLIKKLLEHGDVIPGAKVVEKNNMSVK